MEVTKLSTSISFLMNSIDFESQKRDSFCPSDDRRSSQSEALESSKMIDWYQFKKESAKRQTPGAKAEMSDSEIMTLGLIMDYIPFPGETQFLGAAPTGADRRRSPFGAVRPAG